MVLIIIKHNIRQALELLQDILTQIYIWYKHIFLGNGNNLKNLPVIINNFNRLTTTKELVDYLYSVGLKKIIILDNQSTYKPLLDYYKVTKAEVIRLDANLGHLSLWKSGLYDKYKWNFFVYTDSDILPVEECPDNFMEKFYAILLKNTRIKKVGFSIKIDDLPNHFSFKSQVSDYESKYWKNIKSTDCFEAPIDTTFALYKPFTGLKSGEIYTRLALRVMPPYTIRHKPWYNNTSSLSEEEQYYLTHSNSSSSIKEQTVGNKIY